MKKYTILKDEVEVGRANNNREICEVIGTTKQNYYKLMRERLLQGKEYYFKRNYYQLIDNEKEI
jgi:hypothetical protein